jgi:hypothetical protein
MDKMKPVTNDKPYEQLTSRQFDQMILRCRRALHSHQWEAKSADPERAEGGRGGVLATLETLAELLAVAPPEKRAKIAACGSAGVLDADRRAKSLKS